LVFLIQLGQNPNGLFLKSSKAFSLFLFQTFVLIVQTRALILSGKSSKISKKKVA